MKDYNKPPTWEFEFWSNREHPLGYDHWLTLMKAVMNDYWFDNPVKGDWTLEHIDEFIHKIYFCWYFYLKGKYDEEGWEEE